MEKSSPAEALGEPQLPPSPSPVNIAQSHKVHQSHESFRSLPPNSREFQPDDTSRVFETSEIEAQHAAKSSPSNFSISNTTSLSTSLGRSSFRWSEGSFQYQDRRSSTSSPYSSGRGFSRLVNHRKSRNSGGDSGYGSASIPELDHSNRLTAADNVDPTGSCIYSEPLAASSNQNSGFHSSHPGNLSEQDLRNLFHQRNQGERVNLPQSLPPIPVSSTFQIPLTDVVETSEPPDYHSPDRSVSETYDPSYDVEAPSTSRTVKILRDHDAKHQFPNTIERKDSDNRAPSLSTADRDSSPYRHLPTKPLGRLRAIERTDSLPEYAEDSRTKRDPPSLWTKIFTSAPRHLEPIVFDPMYLEKVGHDRYMHRMAEIPATVVHKWNESIKPQLDQDLQRLIHSADGAKEFILSNVQLCMIGVKRGDTLHAQPTILITCGTKECKKKVEKDLRRLKLHYLDEFGRPIHFRYQPSPLYWAASVALPQDLLDEDTFPLNWQNTRQRDSTTAYTSCGLNLEFTVRQQDHEERFNTTLGGILCIGGVFYGMTTAHTFLANWESIAQRRDQKDLALHPTVNPHRMLSELEVYDGLAYSFFGSVARINTHFDTIESSACSFLGEVSKIHSRSDTVISSASDWALFAIPPSWILPNINRPRGHLTSVSPKSQLRPGAVLILHSIDSWCAGYLTQPSVSFHTKNGVMDVREIALETPLPSGASGSWVVRDSEVCGYVVAVTGIGLSCFMVPMESAFQDIEAVFGQEILFGQELHEAIQRHHLEDEELTLQDGVTDRVIRNPSQEVKYLKPKDQKSRIQRSLSAQPPRTSSRNASNITPLKSLHGQRQSFPPRTGGRLYMVSCPDTLNRPVNTSHKGAMNFDHFSASQVRDAKL